MKIELRKISFSERMSEETYCFVADLYIDGYKSGVVKNDGCGGNTYYTPYDKKGGELIQLSEDYCSSLPDIQIGNFSIPSNLEVYIDGLFDVYLKEKDTKKQMNKLQKDMLTGVCVGTVERYQKHWWKNPITKKPFLLSELMKFEKGKTLIENFVKQKKDKGETILNTNISF